MLIINRHVIDYDKEHYVDVKICFYISVLWCPVNVVQIKSVLSLIYIYMMRHKFKKKVYFI